jgi:heme/copper-type cytochrome/quinol oxidase subunit 3
MAEASEPALAPRVPAVPLGVAIPPEPPDIGARQLYLAARLLAGATAFFFLAFAFAYFYLRSLNQDHAWRPKGIGPEQGLGVAVVLVLVVSAALAIVAGRMMARTQRNWLAAAELSLLLGLAAIVLQCIEWTTQNFGPASGAYASIYCGWTAFFTLGVLMTLYWLETHVATEVRARRRPAPSGQGDIADPDWLIKPGLDAFVFYWSFLVGIGVITYVILYLV